MMSILEELKLFSPLVDLAKLTLETSDDEFPIYTTSLCGSARNLFVRLAAENEKQIYLLFEDPKLLDECNAELNVLGLSDQTILVSELKPEILQEKLTEIFNRDNFILISTYELLLQQLPNREQIGKNTTRISVGGDLSYVNLVEYLNLLNYQKENFVEAPGDFSLRGAIIDFWSYSEKVPVRLEFDGDFLESIRSFDPESQRSIESIKTTTLAGELNISAQERTVNIFDYLKNPLVLASQYELNKLALPSSKEYHKISELKFQDSIDDFPEAEFDGDKTKPRELNFDVNDIIKKDQARWLIEDELGLSNRRIDLGFS